MFEWLKGSTEGVLEQKIETAVRNVLTAEAGRFADTINALPKLTELQAKVQQAEERLAELKSEHVREERETMHKLGLQQKRQEAEAAMAEQRLKDREAQLVAMADVKAKQAAVDAKEEAMKAANELQAQHLDRLDKMVDTMVAALPTAEILATIGTVKVE